MNEARLSPSEVLALTGEGAIEEMIGSRPFVLSDPDDLWLVEEGVVEIFSVELKDGHVVSSRSHFLTVPAGSCMLGMDLESLGMNYGFLAAGRTGTRVRRFSIERLKALIEERPEVATVCSLIDDWIAALGRSLTDDIVPLPQMDSNIEARERLALENQARVSTSRGVVWLEVMGGNLLFVGMEGLVFDRTGAPQVIPQHSILLEIEELMNAGPRQRQLFPLSPSTWVEAANAEGVVTRIDTHEARTLVQDPGYWRAIESFHQVLCQCQFINKRLEAVDELNRLRSKSQHAEAARADAVRELAHVLDEDRGPARPVESESGGDPLLSCCSLIADSLGFEIKAHPEADSKLAFDTRVSLIAKASRVRARRVALRDDWWRHDHGPLLAQIAATEAPIALLPTSTSSYEAVDPGSGERFKVTASLAEQLSPFATSFYRRFPERNLTAWNLMRFGARGLRRDVVTLALMGIALGLLGTVMPALTGTLFDSAIPGADRPLVAQITAALFLVALVSAAFSLTQGIASLRIQSRMDYAIQAALWDRLLDLPSGFFREYSAGDLAERAAGINTIRSLLADAGVGAILGFLSSLFYLGLMLFYSPTLALAAIGLTVVFVAVSFAANFLQLRYQREYLNASGRLTGLVLQLISGISKIRVAGAEDHAYRLWAKAFAHTRRLGFSVGRIQNRAQVFNSGFGVLSSMVIFATLAVTLARSGALPNQGLSTGQFIAFNAAFGMFLTACLTLSEASLGMLRVVPMYERLKPILTSPPETDTLKAYPGQLKGRIELSHLHFRYQQDGPWILRDVSLLIEPGEFVALVGPSGSGKSTLVRLMLGFETPEKGSIYYDGQELSTLDLREVRSQLGVVLQSGQLIPTDIYRNIVGGDTSLSLEDAWEAARLAGLADDVAEMPMGMHTFISEGGGGLSGGQKQRLLIARALVRRPHILFLDEATSALDNRTQAIVAESMDRLQATRVVIAHRLSTIRHADRICVVDHGEIVEQGNYEELIAQGGVFAQLARRQQA